MNRAALKVEIEAALAADSAVNWDAKFIEAGVPAGRVMSVPEILAHPHLVSREFVHEFNSDDAATRQRVTRAGFRFSDADTAPTSPAPSCPRTRASILRRSVSTTQQIDQLRAEGVI